MKKILFLSCAFFLFAAATQAQSNNTDGAAKQQMRQQRTRGMNGMMNADLMKKLNLTTDQQAKLKTLNEAAMQKRNAIKNDASLTDDQKKQAYQDLFKKNNEDRNAIYTPEQKAILEKSRKEWQSKRGERPARPAKRANQGGE